MSRRLIALLALLPFRTFAQTRVANVQLEVKIPAFEEFTIVPNGTRVVTLPKDYPFLFLYLNGLFQTTGLDYTRTGTTITFLYLTPLVGATIAGVGIL